MKQQVISHGISPCGGIAAEAYGNIYNCFAKGTVRGNYNYIGGILGFASGPITVSHLQGLADVYKGGVHVEAAAWDKNGSGGLYGRVASITHNNIHCYIQGTYTMSNQTILDWYAPEFVLNNQTPGVPKLKWE